MIINFMVKNQRLVSDKMISLIERSNNYIQCQFSFSEDWDGLKRYALFLPVGDTLPIPVEIDDNGLCDIPTKVSYYGGQCKLAVIGSSRDIINSSEDIKPEDVIITTNNYRLHFDTTIQFEELGEDADIDNPFFIAINKNKADIAELKSEFSEVINDLKTEHNSDVAQLIKQNNDTNDNIEILDNRQTTDKANLLAAIKEVDTKVNNFYGDSNLLPSDSSLFTFTELEDGTYAVAPKDKTTISGDIVIPYEYNGKKVTAINNANNWECFRDCKGITSIVFPNTITLIGTSAFQGCNFTEITIPGSVKKISNYAFFGCNKLNDVILGDGVEEMGKAVFNACNYITHIEIPSTLSSIYSSDDNASFSCSSAVNNVDVYYNGTRKQFEALNVGKNLLNKGTIYCKYVDESEFSKQDDLSKLTTAFLKGMQIKEFILYPGQTFTMKPNTIFVAFPPDKTMEIYKVDGTRVASEAGIIGAVCSELKYDKDVSKYQFRACTLYQQKGLLGTDYEASYFYFEEGAYIKYTGSSGYARVLCNVPVEIE